MDAQNTYSTKQSIGTSTTVTSTDYIDHGAAVGMGATEGLWLEVVVTTLFDGPGIVSTWVLQQDADAAFSDPTVIATGTSSTALAPAGEYLMQIPMPPVTERYTRIVGTWTSNASAGNFSAGLTLAPNIGYPQS